MGMGDHSRLALCAFMVGLIAFNPFSTFFSSFTTEYTTTDFNARIDQRKILSEDDSSLFSFNILCVSYYENQF